MKKILLLALFPFLLFTNEFQEPPVKDQMRLENGMTVFLKPFDNGENIVTVELVAKGGFLGLPEGLETAGRLAPHVVWKSGITGLADEEVARILYEHSIEVSFSVEPEYRYILSECSRESLGPLLELLAEFFERPKFSLTALQNIVEYHLEETKKVKKDPEQLLENAFYRLNGVEKAASSPLNSKDLKQVDIPSIEKAFQLLFQNPSPFACIIAGDFTIDEAKPLIESTFAEIKKNGSRSVGLSESLSTFPVENKTQTIELKGVEESTLRLSIPLPFLLDEENFYKVDLIAQGLESALRKRFEKAFSDTYSVDVSFELPEFPKRQNAWIMIQLRAEKSVLTSVKEALLKELELIQKDGLPESAIKEAQENIKTSDRFWQNEDEYWVALIANAFLMEFNLENFYRLRQMTYSLPKNALDPLIREIPWNRHTLLILQGN